MDETAKPEVENPKRNLASAQNASGLAFNPSGQFVALGINQLPTIQISDNNFHLIAPANPSRLALYVIASGSAIIQSVSPEDLSGTLYNRTLNDILPIAIHAAQYPVITQGQWFVQVAGVGSVMAWEVTQRD